MNGPYPAGAARETLMKVQCGQCPAKYAVSDERIRDKKVRIRCKRCNASIVVDGKADPPLVTSSPARKSARPEPTIPPPESEPPAPDPRLPSRPVAHTILGGLEAPGAELARERGSSAEAPDGLVAAAASGQRPVAAGMPADGRGFTDPPARGADDRWRVALTKQDLRWMTTGEITEAYQAGAVKLETFVFRPGMPTWVTLPEVPEIADALARAGFLTQPAAAPAAAPRPPSSRPPPRKPPVPAPQRQPTGTASGDELADEAPFALVSGRTNGARKPATPTEASPALAVPAPAPAATPDGHASNGSSPLLVPAELATQPPPAVPPTSPLGDPNLAAPLVPQEGGSKLWLWLVVALFLVGVAVLLWGQRMGLRLPE